MFVVIQMVIAVMTVHLAHIIPQVMDMILMVMVHVMQVIMMRMMMVLPVVIVRVVVLMLGP